jgi:hypothetical protein
MNTDMITYVDDLLAPDVMTPGQFADTRLPSTRTPEQRLMLYVVRDAIILYVDALRTLNTTAALPAWRSVTPSRRRALATVAEIEAWLSESLVKPMAQVPFEMACAAITLDAAAIRERLGQFKVASNLPLLRGLREARGGSTQRVGSRARTHYQINRPRRSQARTRAV